MHRNRTADEINTDTADKTETVERIETRRPVVDDRRPVRDTDRDTEVRS